MSEESLDYRLREVERKLETMIRLGVISECNPEAARARVDVGDFITAPLPWFTRRAGGDADWWAPEADEQVMVLSPSGDLAEGVILPAVYRDVRPEPAGSADIRKEVYGDGLVIEHDRSKKLTRINALDSKGTLVLEAKNIVIRTGEGGYYQLDRYGLVERTTHTGGADYKNESWRKGAVVTGPPDHGHSPPEVSTPEES